MQQNHSASPASVRTDFFTYEDARIFLNLQTVAVVKQLVRKGQLAVVRLGAKTVRIRRSALEAMLAKLETKAHK